MYVKARDPVRDQIATLSTGSLGTPYYDEVYHWWGKLVDILEQAGYPPTWGDCPETHWNEGQGLVHLEGTESAVWFT